MNLGFLSWSPAGRQAGSVPSLLFKVVALRKIIVNYRRFGSNQVVCSGRRVIGHAVRATKNQIIVEVKPKQKKDKTILTIELDYDQIEFTKRSVLNYFMKTSENILLQF